MLLLLGYIYIFFRINCPVFWPTLYIIHDCVWTISWFDRLLKQIKITKNVPNELKYINIYAPTLVIINKCKRHNNSTIKYSPESTKQHKQDATKTDCPSTLRRHVMVIWFDYKSLLTFVYVLLLVLYFNILQCMTYNVFFLLIVYFSFSVCLIFNKLLWRDCNNLILSLFVTAYCLLWSNLSTFVIKSLLICAVFRQASSFITLSTVII